MGKLLRLDQWNFYTKNVNHITTIEKWFEITDWLHLEIESFYFSDFEIEHGVHPQGYSGVPGITAYTGGRYLSVLISFDKLDI